MADTDGTVTSLVVKKLLSGSLKIGSSEATATAYVPGSDAVIDANTHAYWTPAAHANGSGANALGAFSVASMDNGGAQSIQWREVLVDVTPDRSDAAVITKVTLPANGTYATNQTLDFTVQFDRTVTVVTSGGSPSLAITLDSGTNAAATYLGGTGTSSLLFRYSVQPGDKDTSGLVLASAISLNGGQITSLDDGSAVATTLTLPGTASTAGLLIDGINDAPVLTAPANVSALYQEGDPAIPLNPQLLLSDRDSSQLAGATVTISAGFAVGDTLSLPTSVAGPNASYNAATGVLSLAGNFTLGEYEKALRAVSYRSTSSDPTASSSSRTISWQVTDRDGTAPATSTAITSTITITPVNTIPTLSPFSAAAVSGREDSTITIRYGDLIGVGNGQAQVADVDGTVSSLVVKKLLSGSLKIGSSEATATAYVPGSDAVIDANHHAYWTPAAHANGSGANALGAFSVASMDNGGAQSIQLRDVLVDVIPDQSDAAVITRVTLPANGTYGTGDNLDFSIQFDRAVDVTVNSSNTTTNGTPLLPITLDTGSGASASYVSGTGTNTLLFRYSVRSGEFDSSGIAVAAALNLNGGLITSLDDGSPVGATLSLPGMASTAGLRIDGINDAPVLSSQANLAARYQEGDPAITLNPDLALSDSDSTTFSSATVRISAGFTGGDQLALPSQVAASSGVVASWNASTYTLTLTPSTDGSAPTPTLLNALRALRSVTYASSSDTPTATSTSRTIDWQVSDSALASSAIASGSFSVSPVNDAPAFSNLSPGVVRSEEDSTAEIGFATLLAASNASDRDGEVTAFVVQGVSSGSLKLGTTADLATPWAPGTNDGILSGINAYWTPAANANGDGLAAFTVVALDNDGAVSSSPVTVTVDGTPVADSAQITGFQLPTNGIYGPGAVLQFVIQLDRATSLDPAGGLPSLNLQLAGSRSVEAGLQGAPDNATTTYAAGDPLTFAYTVQPGDLTGAGGLVLPPALTVPPGSNLTNLDDGQPVAVNLTLPAASGLGLVLDGVGPLLVAITVAPGSESNRAAQTFRVSFNEPVRGLDATDFKLGNTGTASGRVSAVQAVNASNGLAVDYDVTVNAISGLGRLVLDLKTSVSGITDASGNPLAAGPTSSGSIEVDRVGTFSKVAGDDRLSLAEATNANGVKLKGTVSETLAGQSLDLWIGSALLTTVVAQSDGSWSGVVPKSSLDPLATGDYTLVLKQSSSTLGTKAFAIDREPPTLSNPTTDTALNAFFSGGALLNAAETAAGLTLQGTTDAEANQQVEVQLGGLRGLATVANGNWELTFQSEALQSLNDGPIPLSLFVSDLAGNSTTANYTLTLDRFAAVSLAKISGDGWINRAESSQPLAIRGVVDGVEDGQPVSILVGSRSSNASAPFTATVSAGAFSISVPAGELAWIDGQSYDVTVSGSDLAGNPFTVTQVLKADLVAPIADLKLKIGTGPAIAVGNPRFQGPINTATSLGGADVAAGLVLGSEASSDASSTVVSVNGISQTMTPTSSNGFSSWSLVLDPDRFSLPQEGTVSVSATVSDLAGNSATGSASITMDRSAAITLSTPVDGAGGNNILNATEAAGLTISGTAAHVQMDGSATVVVEVLAEGGSSALITTPVALNSSNWTAPLDLSSLANGTYTLRASVSDGAGNRASASQPFAINTAPPLFTTTVMAGDSILNASEVSNAVPPSLTGFVGNVEDGQSVIVTLPGAGSGAGALLGRSLSASVAGGVWSLPVPADLLAAYGANNGVYAVNLSLTNQAGNTITSTSDFTVDTAAPVLTVINPTDAQWGAAAANPKANPITLSGSAAGLEAGQIVTVVINGKPLQASRDGVDPTQWTLLVPNELLLKGLRETGNSLEVRASDRAGNPAILASTFAAPGLTTTKPIIAVPADGKILATEGDGLIRQFQANQPVRWSLEDINPGLVDINPTTGSFSFLTPIRISDDEGDWIVPFKVVATDGRGNRAIESLNLVVRNLADASSAANVDPLDQDGIAETVEDAATNGRAGITAGDLNNDGIADKLQPNVAAVPWITEENFQAANADPSKAKANSFTSLQSSPAVRISDVQVRKAADLAVTGNGASGVPALITSSTLSQGVRSQASVSYPYDPLVFNLQSYDALSQQALSNFIDAAPALADGSDPYPGTQVRLVMDLPGNGLLVNTYLKWNPSANLGAGGWFEFLADGNASTFDNGAELVDLNGDGRIDQIRLTYTDGDPLGGDVDGLVNGLIQDPGMPGLLAVNAQQGSASAAEVPIVTGDGTNSAMVKASFYGGSLIVNSINTDTPANLVSQQELQSLANNGPGFKLNGGTLGFELELQEDQSQASLYGDLALVGADLTLTDGQSKRLINRRLAYYGFNNGAVQSLIYNPLKKAGARFYDRSGDGTADFLALAMVNGGFGDFGGGAADQRISNSSAAAVLDGAAATLTQVGTDAKTLTVADSSVSGAAVNLVLKASLKQRSGTANQIGYVVLDASELANADSVLTLGEMKSRAQTLFSTLESTDVTLSTDPSFTGFQREILLVNGQSVRFFEVSDGSLDEIKEMNDGRLRFFSLAEVTAQQAFLTSSSGVKFQLDLITSDQGLNALIGQEQGSAALLDFSTFSGTETVTGSMVLAREASYDSVTGFYRTLDMAGSVRDSLGAIVKPGDAGYTAAATLNLVSGLSNLRVGNLQTSVNADLRFTESTYLAPLATVNGATYFAFAAASSDKLNHFKVLGANLFGLEDMAGLGDRDYDDLVIGFRFSSMAAVL